MSNRNNELRDDVRDIRNDIEEIKTDTGTINRILVMAHSDIIIEDLKEIIGNNERTAIIPYILKEHKSLTEIAEIMKIYKQNVYRYLKPFLDKDYVYTQKRGGEAYYKRVEIFDKLRYEYINGIKQLIDSWKEKNLNV